MVACTSSDDTDTYYTDSAYFENVMPYQAQDLSDYISVSGTVASESSVNVSTSVSAKVTKLNVSVGDTVQVGDVLCTLDDTDIQKQIDDLETSIKNATALDDNSKKLNEQALDNAKYDQKVQLKDAQSTIDDAQKAYDKAYKQYTDDIDKINDCVLQYNDVCNRIAQLETEMANQPREDAEEDYGDEDSYDYEYDDDYASLMSYSKTSSAKATNLSYGGSDEYSNLLTQKGELSSKIEAYKQEADSLYETFDDLKKAVQTAKDNYTAVKRSSDQAIESAQNTVDMQEYQEDSNSTVSTQLENLKKQLEDCTIKAEKSGTITSLNVSQGDTTTEGALLMTIENDSQLKLTVAIDEKDILKIKEGMNVVVTSDATGDAEIHGTVSKVITVVSSNSNSQSMDGSSSTGFTAEITIDEDCDLLVGMSAKAKIMLVEKSDCYAVLYDCIMYDDDGIPYVLVAEPNDDTNSVSATVKRVDVTLGDESGSYVEVSSDNLKVNDLIITTPEEVAEGDTLQLDPYSLDYSSEDEDAEVVG
jgi:RND family efflux transporter MFP subunit